MKTKFDEKKKENENVQSKTVQEFVKNAQTNNLNLTLLKLHLLKIPISVEKNFDFLQLLEFYSSGIGIVEQLKLIPFDLKMYRLRMPEDVCSRHNINIRNAWDRLNTKPKDDFFDVVLE